MLALAETVIDSNAEADDECEAEADGDSVLADNGIAQNANKINKTSIIFGLCVCVTRRGVEKVPRR